jgi:hypothetical protein
MSNCTTALSCRRIEAIFDDCVDTTSSETLYGNGVISDVKFHDVKLQEHRQEVQDMLLALSSEVRSGNSWRAFMFDLRESKWASPVVATKLIALACSMGLVTRYSHEEERALEVPLYELPWYRVTV